MGVMCLPDSTCHWPSVWVAHRVGSVGHICSLTPKIMWSQEVQTSPDVVCVIRSQHFLTDFWKRPSHLAHSISISPAKVKTLNKRNCFCFHRVRVSILFTFFVFLTQMWAISFITFHLFFKIFYQNAEWRTRGFDSNKVTSQDNLHCQLLDS